jgi:histidine kinase/DNA gyrase B/HSP90-like ATPase
MVRLLDDGAHRATGLVDSILEYATAGDDGARRTEVDCGEVVSEVLAMLASQIERVDGRVEVGALPTLKASRSGLVRVFQNLIANAFKFHNGDTPYVAVTAKDGAAGWAFSVRDNGIGLPEDSAIFEMFTRGGSEREGSGTVLRPAGASSRPMADASGPSPRLEAAAPSTSRCRPDTAHHHRSSNRADVRTHSRAASAPPQCARSAGRRGCGLSHLPRCASAGRERTSCSEIADVQMR